MVIKRNLSKMRHILIIDIFMDGIWKVCIPVNGFG